MLTLWRRHNSTCTHKADRYYRKCRCAMWCEGTVESKYIRRSLKTRSWVRAEELKREIEDGQSSVPSIKLSAATPIFLASLSKKNVSPATVRKFELLFKTLPDLYLNQITIRELEQVRNKWTWSALTSSKYIERLRRFFKFAVKQKWVTENPALDLEMPRLIQKQVAPFELDEVHKIEREASKHPRHYAMVLLLRHSGLRIADAVMLPRKRLKDGNLFLYTSKTGSPVWLPLPEHVVLALCNCPNKSTDYFFCTGEGKKSTAVNNWRDDLSKLFLRAGVTHAHPHRYRHTLAASLLEQGVPISEVAMILGNSSKIVEKHYAGWNLARQKKLESIIKTVWQSHQKLVRVK